MATYVARLAPVLVLALYLGVLGVIASPAAYATVDVVVIGLLYLLVATAVWSGARALTAWGRVGRLLGAYGVGCVVVWQLREQTRLPDSLVATAAWAAAAAVVAWFVLGGRRRRRWRRDALWCVCAALLLVVGVAVVYHSSNLLRWHLLRHNTLVGTPAFYVLGEPVVAHEEELFSAERQPRSPGTAPAQPPADPADVVFVLLDTLRADALAGYGAERSMMPALDRFLADGYRFTDVIANASWTRPTMASFFTGLLPEEHGARDIDDALPEELETLAEVYRDRGYETAAFVTNSAAVGAATGFDQGFERWIEFPQEPYARAELVGDTVARWLEARNDPRPLFLYLHLLDPHEPYLAGVEPDGRRAHEYRRAYAAELAYLDDELADIFESVADRLPRAAVFVASDHGEEFFEHGLSGHGHSLYRELLDIPVGLRLLGASDGGVVDARLESRDFFDLLTALGNGFDVDGWAERNARGTRYASVYYTMEGRLVLRPYLRQIAMRAVETSAWKLVWSGYGDTWELYADGQEPVETNNLMRRRPERAAELRARMDRAVDVWRPGVPFTPSVETRRQLRALGYVE